MHPKLVWGGGENEELVARIKAAEARSGEKPAVSIVRTVDPHHWFWFGMAILLSGCGLLAWSWYRVSQSLGPIPSDTEAALITVLVLTLCLTGGIIVAQAERALLRR